MADLTPAAAAAAPLPDEETLSRIESSCASVSCSPTRIRPRRSPQDHLGVTRSMTHARSSTPGQSTVDRLAAPLRAPARPRAPALRGRAAPRRRDAAQPPSGRCALRHAHRAAGRGAAHRQRQRGRRRGGRRGRGDPARRGRSPAGRGLRQRGPRARRARRRVGLRPDETRTEVIVDEDVPDDEEPLDYDAAAELDIEAEEIDEAPEDPNAHKRFWFEHATGAGKTVAAMGFVDASRTGGILILTHRRNLVDQFNEELRTRGYGKRVRGPLLDGQDAADGPVTVETYQWFVRNAGNISSAYTVVICDEAHTALGEKTAGAIRNWTGPIFIGMTATGALIARHVTDLFPTQTSRFDLAQAARRGVISPLRCVRIPPGPGVRTIAKVPLRRGEVDTEFDQEMLAELLDQLPFNLAAANLYKTRFNGMPGVVYAAGVRHAYNLAEAFREEGIKAEGVSGETPKRQLAEILAKYERGDIDVLINAQLLAEGWNSPRATICFHLAPTASKRIYQQRVGRVTRRHPGKESGIVVDFVHPGTKHDDPVVTLHSLLDRDVYRGGAIVVGPVRRGRGRRVRVERRVLPVASDENRRIEVFERELWRIAVEHLDWGEQIQWAALAGARVSPSGWRRARAMLHFDRTGDLKRAFLLTAVQRNKNPQLRLRALQEIAAARDAEAFDLALDEVGGWPREEKRESCKLLLQALAEKRIGRRDQADAWIWRGRRLHRGAARGVRRPALAGDEAAARPAGELVGWRPRAQRAAARPRGAQAGPPAGGRAARRRHAVHAHARGRGGPARRPHPDGPQALVAVARAAAQLPQGPPRALAAPQEEGLGRSGGRQRAGRGGGRRRGRAERRGTGRSRGGPRGRAGRGRRARGSTGQRRCRLRGAGRRHGAEASPPPVTGEEEAGHRGHRRRRRRPHAGRRRRARGQAQAPPLPRQEEARGQAEADVGVEAQSVEAVSDAADKPEPKPRRPRRRPTPPAPTAPRPPPPSEHDRPPDAVDDAGAGRGHRHFDHDRTTPLVERARDGARQADHERPGRREAGRRPTRASERRSRATTMRRKAPRTPHPRAHTARSRTPCRSTVVIRVREEARAGDRGSPRQPVPLTAAAAATRSTPLPRRCFRRSSPSAAAAPAAACHPRAAAAPAPAAAPVPVPAPDPLPAGRQGCLVHGRWRVLAAARRYGGRPPRGHAGLRGHEQHAAACCDAGSRRPRGCRDRFTGAAVRTLPGRCRCVARGPCRCASR